MTKMSYLSLICHTLFMSRCTKIRSIIDTAELNKKAIIELITNQKTDIQWQRNYIE